MTPQSAALMADYNRWMNQRMYQAAAGLSEAELVKERGAFFGSILRTLNHIAVADTIWMHRFSENSEATVLAPRLQAFPRPNSLQQELATSLDGLRSYRDNLDALIVLWAESLTALQIGSNLSYGNTAGKASSKSFGALIQHFFNHQTHHRGQVSTLLFQAGVDIGVTDLLAVIPNQP